MAALRGKMCSYTTGFVLYEIAVHISVRECVMRIVCDVLKLGCQYLHRGACTVAIITPLSVPLVIQSSRNS